MFPPPNPLFQQRQRTMGTPRNVAYMPGTGPGTGTSLKRLVNDFKGLNNYFFLQDRSRPAFANPRIPYGMGRSAEEMAGIATGQGKIYRPDLGGFVPDTMYYRTMGSRGMDTVPNVQPQPPQMTDQQMEWARKAQAGKSGSDVLGKMGEKMAGFSRPPGMLGSAFSVAQTAANAASSRFPEFSFSQGGNPYSGTRAQNFQNMLDAGGDFAQIRQDYNREAAGTGYSMGDGRTMGRISYNPYANTLGREQLQSQIDTKRAAEMAARGEGAVQRFNTQGAQANISPEMERGGFRQTSGSAFKVNPYGTATATFGERKGPGMVKDELTGKMVPISQAVADMKAVQATKGIDPETGAPMSKEGAEAAQDKFFQSKNQKISKRENGGPVKKGNPYLVGEKGPEIIVPKQDGTVIPNGMKIPIIQDPADQVAYRLPEKQTGGVNGFLLAVNQRLKAVAPSRGESFFSPMKKENGYILKEDKEAKQHGIIPLKPTEEMLDGADTLIKLAMAETNSQDQAVLMNYIRNKLQKSGLIK